MLLGRQEEVITTMNTSLYDEMRMNWLIAAMCHDLSMKRKEVIDDLEGLQTVPIRNRVAIISEIRMAYS